MRTSIIPPWSPPPAWTEDAACAYVDPELWFPEKGGSAAPAKRICRDCPVRAQCLDWALQNDERFGVFGGMSERERRDEKKRRAAAAREHKEAALCARSWRCSPTWP